MAETKNKEKLEDFTCKIFKSKSCNEMHVISEHSYSKKRYECDICGKSFAWPSGRSQHKLKHLQRKLNQCIFCTKTFVKKKSLKLHLHSHDHCTPYNCGKCNKKFANLQQLQSHMQQSLCAKPSCELSKQIPIKKEFLSQSVGYKRGHFTYRNKSYLNNDMKNEYRETLATERQHSDKGIVENGLEVKASTKSYFPCKIKLRKKSSHSKFNRRTKHISMHKTNWTCKNCNKTFALHQSYLIHHDTCLNDGHQCLICHVTISQLLSSGQHASTNHTHVMTLLREPTVKKSLSLPQCTIDIKKETEESIAELVKKIKQDSKNCFTEKRK